MENALAKKLMGMIVEFKVGRGGGGAFLTSQDLLITPEYSASTKGDRVRGRRLCTT
jgi:hypothetical protein